MTDPYKVQIQCDNCNVWFNLEIPKGTTFESFRTKNEQTKCTSCECMTDIGRIL